MTGTNLVVPSSRRIISVLHSLPGLLPDCTDLQEPCLSNWSCLFWLLFPCIFSTSENWVWFLSKFLHNMKYLLVPLHFPVALCHYMISLFWLGGMCVLNQPSPTPTLSPYLLPVIFFFFFVVGVFFKKENEGVAGSREAGVHILQGALPEEDSPLGR